MGFWHTGYMEFHEETMEHRPSAPPPPPVYICQLCGTSFDSPTGYDIHRFEGHAVQRPSLLFRGVECGSTRLEITTVTQSTDWTVLRSAAAWINDSSVDPDLVPAALANYRRGTVAVRLASEGAEGRFDIHIAVADPHDLDGVDHCLHQMAEDGRLDIGAIEHFLNRSARFTTAAHYRHGIATYLYGVLARERSEDSNLPHEEYRSRYDSAAATLSDYDRPPAVVISDLIAFHYNQFALVRSIDRRPDSRLAKVTSRYQQLLANIEATASASLADVTNTAPEGLFSDAETERVLSWSRLPLDGTAPKQEVNAIEAYLGGCAPFDALKLQLVVACHHLHAGNLPAAAGHAHNLRNNAVASEWAKGLLANVKRREN